MIEMASHLSQVVRRRQEDDDLVLQPLRDRLPHQPDRLEVRVAPRRRGRVERDVALVKTYMIARPYDLELERSEAGGTVLEYRLRPAS